MEPEYKTDMGRSPLEAFAFVFKWWLFIFLIVLLPLDFLYRAGALLANLPPLQLVRDCSVIVVFFTVIALILAFISLLFALFIKGSEVVVKINAICGYFFILITIADYSWKWIKVILLRLNMETFINYKLILLISFLLFIILIVGSISIFDKYRFAFKNNNIIFGSFYKFNKFVIIFSVLVSLLSIYFSQGETKLIDSINQGKSLAPHPNIIIITFDALAAQYTSLYGYAHQTTPNLEELGQESYVFEGMYSSSNWTVPSLASLITAKKPYNHHQVSEQYSYFGGKSRSQNLAALLKELGYKTAMVWGNELASPFTRDLKGFDNVLPSNTLKNTLCEVGLGPNPWLFNLYGQNRFTKSIYNSLRWLSNSFDKNDPVTSPEFSLSMAKELVDQLKTPFFLWVHLWPPHFPYIANADFLYTVLPEKIFDKRLDYYERLPVYDLKEQPMIDKLFMRYRENIAYADAEFGKFLAFLREKGVFDQTILIFSSDHGEMFEKGFWSHGGPYLYQPLIHVPMILHLPGQTQGLRVGANVSQVDIAPTVLDFLGVKPPDWMDGKSFKGALEGKGLATEVKFSMQLGATNSLPNLMTRSMAAIKGNYKLIKYLDWNRYELYDVKNDPQEKVNLIDRKPEIFSALKAEIDRLPVR